MDSYTQKMLADKLPEQWYLHQLGSIGSFYKGKGIPKKEIGSFGYPCITYGEIYKSHDFVIRKFQSFISEEIACNSFELQNGDILFAGSGEKLEEIGKSVAFIDKFKAYAGGDIIILRQECNAPIFLGYLLNHDVVRRQLYKLGQGHSVVHIYPNGLSTLLIPIPPLPEQRAIARILSTWDRAIDRLQKLIAKKQERKKGFMQQLLSGKKRFAGFEGEWQEVRLGSLLDLSSGASKPKDTTENLSDNTQIPVYGGNGLTGYSSASNLSEERILIGRVGEYCGCIHVVSGVYWVTDNCLYVKNLSPDVDLWFLAEFLSYFKLSKLKNKGGQPLVSQQPIKNLKIIKPPLPEQQKIASVLSAADREIEKLQGQLEKLQEQKKGLMQKLLTGKVRVSEKADE